MIDPVDAANTRGLPSNPPATRQNLGEWLMAHRAAVLTMLTRLRFPAAVTEDAVQDCLLRALVWIHTGRAGRVRNWTNWLRTVAIRSALTRLGRGRTRRLGIDPAVWPTDHLEAEEAEEEARVRTAAVRSAVAALPPALGSVFVHCQIDGHTLRAAAGRFALPLGTVNARLIRAREAVRTAVGVPGRPRQKPGRNGR